jgi:hypothetical protein
VLLAEVTQA